MSSVVPPRRPFVLKASRDTLVLLAAATGLALAIGYSAHNRPMPDIAKQATEQAVAGEWTGQLAALAPTDATATAPSEPLSSDALTVPKAAMALPTPPRPATPKPRPCDGASCPTPARTAGAVTATPTPNRRAPAPHLQPVREASLMERINPLNHLPDVVKRPFASAGDTIAGWVRRF